MVVKWNFLPKCNRDLLREFLPNVWTGVSKSERRRQLMRKILELYRGER